MIAQSADKPAIGLLEIEVLLAEPPAAIRKGSLAESSREGSRFDLRGCARDLGQDHQVAEEPSRSPLVALKCGGRDLTNVRSQARALTDQVERMLVHVKVHLMPMCALIGRPRLEAPLDNRNRHTGCHDHGGCRSHLIRCRGWNFFTSENRRVDGGGQHAACHDTHHVTAEVVARRLSVRARSSSRERASGGAPTRLASLGGLPPTRTARGC